MLETEFIKEIKPDKQKRISNERSSYEWIKKKMFKKSFKLYSPVLRGLPDFMASEVLLPELEAGFYEVKFENRKLSTQQVNVLSEMIKIACCYIVRVYRDGTIKVYQIKGVKDGERIY